MPRSDIHEGSMGRLQSPSSMIGSIANEKDDDDLISTSTETVEREIPRVLAVLSTVLERLIARNEKYLPNSSRTRSSQKLTNFQGLRPPSISISRYLERLFRYTSCSPSCFVLGYVYIDRLVHKQPDSPVISLNIHRLLVTSVMLATKILDDEHFNNSFFARVGGVRTSELNKLELELLFRLDFKLFVTTQEFESYCMYLEKEALMSSCKVERKMPVIDTVSSLSASSFQESPVYKSKIEFANRQPSFKTVGKRQNGDAASLANA